jgi:predicted permease
VLAKNAIQPALCFGVAILLDMSLDETKYVVLICAIPCGFFGVLFGELFHTTPEVASSSLIASTVLAIFTLAGWIVILSHVH